jgi:hypothetical protein
MSVPRYKHDCLVVGHRRDENVGMLVGVNEDACRFIGCLSRYDLYIHERNYSGLHHVECIARYGDDGPEYLSGSSAKRLIVEFLGDS